MLLLMENLIVRLEWRYNRKYCEDGQQIESRYCHNIIVTKVTIAIVTMTMVTKRDVEFTAA